LNRFSKAGCPGRRGAKKRAFVVAACLILSLAIAVAPASSAQTDLGKRVTINVTQVAPGEAFEFIARELGCTITVDPAVEKPLTVQVVDMPVTDVITVICRSIEREYRFDGKNLLIKPLSAGRRRQMASMEEHSRKLDSRLPAGMRFDDTPFKDVLDIIGEAAGLELRPWKDEGSRKVTIDGGCKTVNGALEVLVRQIDGEGVVMMKTWAGSWGQCRSVDERRGSQRVMK
jgi:type II secretory pathway component GspD/PulD (secretin)